MTSTPRLDLVRESERLFLVDLLRSPSGIAGMTSAPPPFDRRPFRDGGKWRGDIPRALARRGIVAAVTAKAGAVAAPAERPTRNRTCIRLWRLIDRPAAERRLAALSKRQPTERSLLDLID